MSQGAISVANGPGATVRAAINDALARLQTGASGTARPADIGTYELWIETDNPGGGISSVWRWDGAADILTALLNTSTHVLTYYQNSLAVATESYVTAALAGAASSGFVNKARNGIFVDWVKGTTGTVGAAATGSAAIAANGWAIIAAGATVAFARDTGTNRSLYALKVTGDTSVTGIVLGQRCEGMEGAQLASQRILVQARIYNNSGGSVTPQIATRYPGALDDWTTPAADLAATNLQACGNAAWTRVAYVLDVHANAARGYEVKFDFGNNWGANTKYFKIAEVDIRVVGSGISTGLNSSPPDMEFPHVQSELNRNARYFRTTYAAGTSPGAVTAAGRPSANLVAVGAAISYWQENFSTEMHHAPTVAYYDMAGNASKMSLYNGNGGGSKTDNVAIGTAPTNISSAGFQWVGNTGTGGTAYIHYTAYADFW